MTITEREFHPYATIFPLMSEKELQTLAADIAENGQREPILIDKDGRIVDGRNRYMACKSMGMDAQAKQWRTKDDDELLLLILSKNLHRRHLTPSQRAMVAAEIANLKRGTNRFKQKVDPPAGGSTNALRERDPFLPACPNPPPLNPEFEAATQDNAAKMLQVGKRSIQRAQAVKSKGAPELVEAVKKAEVGLFAAAEVAELPRDKQAELIARGEKEILEAAKRIREQRKAQMPQLTAAPQSSITELRPSLRKFAEACESVLRNHEYKGGWENESLLWLAERVREQADDLWDMTATLAGEHEVRFASIDAVKKEACDVANFAMMIFDVACD